MEVYLIKKGTMSGSSFMKKAFIEEKSCSLTCEDLKEEWVSYEPFKTAGEEIQGNRIIVYDKIYDLDRRHSKDLLKARALKNSQKKKKKHWEFKT